MSRRTYGNTLLLWLKLICCMVKDNSKLFLLVLLGMLTAFGPFVTDMYLPSLPAMGDYFQTASSMVQLGLTTSMIGLAAGQILFGPLSDRYGRRIPLLAAMWLFIVSTILCLFARDIHQFVAFRLVQGIAGAGGIVIARSVAADKYSGKELAKMLAVIGAINGWLRWWLLLSEEYLRKLSAGRASSVFCWDWALCCLSAVTAFGSHCPRSTVR